MRLRIERRQFFFDIQVQTFEAWRFIDQCPGLVLDTIGGRGPLLVRLHFAQPLRIRCLELTHVNRTVQAFHERQTGVNTVGATEKILERLTLLNDFRHLSLFALKCLLLFEELHVDLNLALLIKFFQERLLLV